MFDSMLQRSVAGDPIVAGPALFEARGRVIAPTRWIAPNSTRRFRGERPC